jgi:predicted Rossmann fold nucleotide-binding protein DprA/Smf involved in DNA uptake
VKRCLEFANTPIAPIVGARNGSAADQKFTRQLANALGLEGFAIASETGARLR